MFSSWRYLKPRHILKVLLTLLHPPFITGLVLGADQAVRTAVLIGDPIQVACTAPDRILHMGAGR